MEHQKVARTLRAEPQSEIRAVTEPVPSTQSAAHPILYLQRMIGNQGVHRLLQAKLQVDQPSNKSEQEADRMAKQVLFPSATGEVQPVEPAAASPATEHSIPPIVQEVLSSPGHSLEPDARKVMESHFGHDFSQVRVHTDEKAVESAQAVNASAYTVGRDVVFGVRQYAPETSEGKRLIAHELTHVVQQSGGGHLRGVNSSPGRTIQRKEALPASEVGNDKPGSTPTSLGAREPEKEALAKLPPSPEGEIVVVGDIPLSTDASYVRFQLEQLTKEHGHGGLEGFWAYFQDTLEREDAQVSPTDVSGVPEWFVRLQHRVALLKQIQPVLRQQVLALRQEHASFMERFEKQARDTLEGVLRTSRERVTTEANRYGIKLPGATSYPTRATGFAKQGLREAALKLLKPLRSLMSLLRRQHQLSRAGITYPDVLNPEQAIKELQALRDPISRTYHDYNLLRDELEKKYPILAAFAPLPSYFRPDDVTAAPIVLKFTFDRLSAIASEQEMTEPLANEIEDKLEKIQTVQDALANNELKIWKLENIVALAEQQLGIEEGSVQHAWIGERASQMEISDIVKIALGVVAFALGLIAALPTGGTSVAAGETVAAAAIGTVLIGVDLTIADFQEYELKKAASGTDFDKARAVSQEEPSLFWLAFDIVTIVMDVNTALKAFRALSETVAIERVVKTARTAAGKGADLKKLLDAVEEEVDHVTPGKGKLVRQRVAEDIARTTGVGGKSTSRLAQEELVWVNPNSRNRVYHTKDSPFYENTKEGWLATETEAKLAGYRRAESGLEAAERGTAEHEMIKRAMRPFEGQVHQGGWILEKVERSVGTGRVDELWRDPVQKRIFVFDTFTGPVESLEHYRKGWEYSLEPEIQKYIQQGYTYGYSVAIKHPTKLH